MTSRHAAVARAVLGAALIVAAAVADVARAADAVSTPASSSTARRHLDPGMPTDAARAAAAAERRSTPAASGDALNADVDKQLRDSFDAADVAHLGTLTRAQAQAGGFGFVALHFDAIDARHAGAVSFDDLRRYLQSRGARYVAK